MFNMFKSMSEHVRAFVETYLLRKGKNILRKEKNI